MGTYTVIVGQKKVDDKWVTLEPLELGFDPEIPHHYGKLNMMWDLDTPEFRAANPGIHRCRQDFQSPWEDADPDECAPWSRRGYPEDMDDYLRNEVFDIVYACDASWAMLDEILAYDFDKEQIVHCNQTMSWTELLGPSYRLWFEKLRDYGAERVIYSNC